MSLPRTTILTTIMVKIMTTSMQSSTPSSYISAATARIVFTSCPSAFPSSAKSPNIGILIAIGFSSRAPPPPPPASCSLSPSSLLLFSVDWPLICHGQQQQWHPFARAISQTCPVKSLWRALPGRDELRQVRHAPLRLHGGLPRRAFAVRFRVWGF